MIAPAFYSVHFDIQNALHTHYRLSGGRGSAKSSFVSIEIILGIMLNPDTNAIAVRKIGSYLRDSVFSQLQWAIKKLGVEDLWSERASPLELIYKPTGQRIMFRGADKPEKLKSTKPADGYIRYVWYEELDEFRGTREIRSINQSLLRGGDVFTVFYTYNPPASRRSWVNREAVKAGDDTFVHKSTYLDVPPQWLGERFIIEAEHLKRMNINAYKNEYLGEETGSGNEIFKNLNIRAVTREEIDGFDKIRCGVDFGYAADPFVFLQCFYHKNRLVIFDEIYASGLSNAAAAERISQRKIDNSYIICDSAEPKSIRDLREHGLRARGAKKGPDSIEYGIKFLQSLDEIVIDPKRAPNAEREFSGYELEENQNGEVLSSYPDKNNHTIDAARYALEEEINCRKARIIKRREFGI
ncbi:MAG: PBSX family phage terminase large subunit [Firmicutes bacterium]|nr:PBSX family phage terminase large subunit [Bacillota bacterium]